MNQRKLAADQPGPVFVVLGATGGIGSVLSRRLASSGARLVLGARDADRLRRLASELGATARPLNATEFDQVDACFAEAEREFGRIDGVANLVGSMLLKPAHQTSVDEWESTVAQNLGSAFAAVRAGATESG